MREREPGRGMCVAGILARRALARTLLGTLVSRDQREHRLLGTLVSRPHFRSRALPPRTFGLLRARYRRSQERFPRRVRESPAVGRRRL